MRKNRKKIESSFDSMIRPNSAGPSPWYCTKEGWRRFFCPTFVLPSPRQVPLTLAIHFGCGILALIITGLRSLFIRHRKPASEKILFAGRHHLGDVLMALPAMQLARGHLPKASMTLVVQERYRHQLHLSEIGFQTLPEIEGASFWSEFRAWCERFRGGAYDTVVFHRITRPDFPSILAAFAMGVPQRMGGAEKGLQGLLTNLYCPEGRELVVNYHLNLVRAWLRIPPAGSTLYWPVFSPPSSLPQQWDLLIAPFAQHSKEWPTEHWHALLRHGREKGWTVALSAGPDQASRAAEFLLAFPEVENLSTRSRTLTDLFEHVRQAQCIIALDTGIRHVAAALAVPCVVLGHGREHRELFGAYVPTERYLVFSVPCAPCGAEPCPLRHLRCIRNISLESVLTARNQLLEGGARHPAANPQSPP